MRIVNKYLILLVSASVSLASCVKEPEPTDNNGGADDFDRKAMLENISDNYIIPGYDAYYAEILNIEQSITDFQNSPSIATLQDLRQSYTDALISWQSVSFIDFGPSSSVALIAQTNVYPIDSTLILYNIANGEYSLAAGNQYPAKGWQAFDYLLFGQSDDNANLNFLNSSNVIDYMNDLVNDLKANTEYVQTNWTTYRTTFVNNVASNASGSAVSDLLNGIVQNYEVHIRKGKVGVPTGVFNGFSQQPMPGHVEGLYEDAELQYAQECITYFKRFLNGMNYLGTTDGIGILDYATFVEAQIDGQPMATVVNSQLDVINNISDSAGEWSDLVVSNPTQANNIYVEYQKMVPYIKVDLTSALGVIITYQDNDGD